MEQCGVRGQIQAALYCCQYIYLSIHLYFCQQPTAAGRLPTVGCQSDPWFLRYRGFTALWKVMHSSQFIPKLISHTGYQMAIIIYNRMSNSSVCTKWLSPLCVSKGCHNLCKNAVLLCVPNGTYESYFLMSPDMRKGMIKQLWPRKF
jgi:hypothetical protein